MPLEAYPRCQQPEQDTKLWRYTDIPKFLELITSGKLWVSNLDVLAKDDPFEGLLGSYRFPHRIYRSVKDLTTEERESILEYHLQNTGKT